MVGASTSAIGSIIAVNPAGAGSGNETQIVGKNASRHDLRRMGSGKVFEDIKKEKQRGLRWYVVGIVKRCCDRTVFFGFSDFLAKAVFNCNTKTPLYKGWGGV